MIPSPRSSAPQSGFSLVEMLVVVSIFLIITSVILFSQDKFSSNISLSNVAYELALKIRQTQVYGILVRENREFVESSYQFNSAYGVHFYEDAADNDVIKFRIFADNPEEGDVLRFDQDSTDEILSSHALAEGNIISDVCTYYFDDDDIESIKCFSDDITYADIVFKRPEPAALITDSSSNLFKHKIVIYVDSALGDRSRRVEVFGVGQISVYAN